MYPLSQLPELSLPRRSLPPPFSSNFPIGERLVATRGASLPFCVEAAQLRGVAHVSVHFGVLLLQLQPCLPSSVGFLRSCCPCAWCHPGRRSKGQAKLLTPLLSWEFSDCEGACSAGRPFYLSRKRSIRLIFFTWFRGYFFSSAEMRLQIGLSFWPSVSPCLSLPRPPGCQRPQGLPYGEQADGLPLLFGARCVVCLGAQQTTRPLRPLHSWPPSLSFP